MEVRHRLGRSLCSGGEQARKGTGTSGGHAKGRLPLGKLPAGAAAAPPRLDSPRVRPIKELAEILRAVKFAMLKVALGLSKACRVAVASGVPSNRGIPRAVAVLTTTPSKTPCRSTVSQQAPRLL